METRGDLAPPSVPTIFIHYSASRTPVFSVVAGARGGDEVRPQLVWLENFDAYSVLQGSKAFFLLLILSSFLLQKKFC